MDISYDDMKNEYWSCTGCGNQLNLKDIEADECPECCLNSETGTSSLVKVEKKNKKETT